MSGTRELKEVSRSIIDENLEHKSIHTLQFLIKTGAINVGRMFTTPVLNDDDAYFLTHIFFTKDDGYGYFNCKNIWNSLLPTILEVLKEKQIQPRTDRVNDLLQLIACNDFTKFEFYLEAFSSFFSKNDFIKIVNNLIICLPTFTQLTDKKTSHWNLIYGFSSSIHNQFHNSGNNLLSASLFYRDKPYSAKTGYMTFLYTPENIQQLIQKYHLDINAPNQVLEPVQTIPDWWSSRRGERYFEATDMTVSYKTTLGRVFNVFFNSLSKPDKSYSDRFAQIITFLIPFSDSYELEEVFNWYKNSKEVSAEDFDQIQSVYNEINRVMKDMRDSVFQEMPQSLFGIKGLKNIVAGYLELSDVKEVKTKNCKSYFFNQLNRKRKHPETEDQNQPPQKP